MTVHTPPLFTDAPNGILRFITCGSVDDGKSTLLGRLLYDSKLLFDDQLNSLAENSQKFGNTHEGDLDFALLVDGLEDELQQGITIDVAYRYFATSKRKFIVADTPGHEQYTRNMVTGASTADLAVLLIDARKGLLPQTRRHSYLVNMLGIKNIVVAINKMDLVDYSQDVFQAIEMDIKKLANDLKIDEPLIIPVSALKGDNVFTPSSSMTWYKGPLLMDHLETVAVEDNRQEGPFRFPVQWVNRPHIDFRGFAGTLVSGKIKMGDEVIVLPSALTTRIDKIYTPGGERDEAVAGEAITLTTNDEVDIVRGDVLCPLDDRLEVADQFAAQIVWMSEDEMLAGRPYLMKIGNKMLPMSVTDIKHKININTYEEQPCKTLELNEIADVNISLSNAVPFAPFDQSKELGSFIIIDRLSNNTVGAGMLRFALRRSHNLHMQALEINKSKRAEMKAQKPCVLWFTGLSGSGKSTVANLVEKKLFQAGKHCYILDGDNVRHGLNRDLGFTDADRVENIRRISEVAKLMVDAGLIVLVSFISPFRTERRMAREMMDENEFFEVFVDTPLEVCEQRDIKGLYKKARAGEIKNFTGIDSAYEVPERADIHLKTTEADPEELANQVIDHIAKI